MTTAELTPQEQLDLAALLRTRRRSLDATIQRDLHSQGIDELSVTFAGESDRTTADIEATDALAKLERDTQEIEAIDHALEKCESDAFGHCEGCGDAIGYPRLLAHPTARLCLNCQTQVESSKRAGQPAGGRAR